MDPKRVLITGATGFVGRSLVPQLLKRDYTVRAATRFTPVPGGNKGDQTETVIIPSIDGKTDWSAALEGVDSVVHLAARVHIMRRLHASPASLFHTVNVDGTACLGAAALAAGVRKFIYISSIKVNGERTVLEPFTESSVENPVGEYAQSKWQSEQALWKVVSGRQMQAVVIRPPMVYGPGAPGNFSRLMRLVRAGVPVPLGSVRNRRSFVYVENLCDAICACLQDTAANGQTFLLSDGEDVSTPELMRMLSKNLGRTPKLFPLPAALLKYGAITLGLREEADRLLESLVVDSRKIQRLLRWKPPFSMTEGVRATALGYLKFSV